MALSRTTTIAHCGLWRLVYDLSMKVADALDDILPNEHHRLVRRVKVSKGWGEIHFVTVYAGVTAPRCRCRAPRRIDPRGRRERPARPPPFGPDQVGRSDLRALGTLALVAVFGTRSKCLGGVTKPTPTVGQGGKRAR